MKQQNILVAGLGSTGLSILRYLDHIGASQVAAYEEQRTAERHPEHDELFPLSPDLAGSL